MLKQSILELKNALKNAKKNRDYDFKKILASSL